MRGDCLNDGTGRGVEDQTVIPKRFPQCRQARELYRSGNHFLPLPDERLHSRLIAQSTG
jgi:hypothetical protein